jgi:hypothetical protein
MKKAFLPLALGMLLTTGCSTRLVDFTIMSSKNVDLTRVATFERAKNRVEGTDMAHIIIFIPTGTPNAKEAMDRAIESVPGAVALVDGVITYKFFYIPYIYGQQSYVVEGTALIDPQLVPGPKQASTLTGEKYLITYLDKKGNVKETISVSKAEYDQYKARMVPAS